LQDAERKLKDSRARLEGQSKEIAALKKELMRAQKRNDELEADLRQASGESSRVSTLEHFVDKLRSEKHDMDVEIRQLRRQVKESNQRKNAMEKELKENTEFLQSIKQRMISTNSNSASSSSGGGGVGSAGRFSSPRTNNSGTGRMGR